MQKLSVQFRFFQILSNIFQYNCPKNVVGCRSSPIAAASRTDSDGYLPHAHGTQGMDLHRTYVGTSTRFSSGHEHELGRRRRAGACLPLPPGRRGTTVMLPTAPIAIPCQLPRRGPAPLCVSHELLGARARAGPRRRRRPSHGGMAPWIDPQQHAPSLSQTPVLCAGQLKSCLVLQGEAFSSCLME